MIVECGKCSTKFKIGGEKVTNRGVKVRCSKCKYVFVVKKGGLVEPVPAETAPAKPEPGPVKHDIPDDVFRVPTKVSTPPPADVAASRSENKFPVPSPDLPVPPPRPPAETKPPAVPKPPDPKPSGQPPVSADVSPPAIPPPDSLVPGASTAPTDGRSLADQIDLDMEEFDLPGAPPESSQPEKPSAPGPSGGPSRPEAGVGGDLFSDLLGVDPGGTAPPKAAPVSPPAALDDDPFADIDISAPGPAQIPATGPDRPPDPAPGPSTGQAGQDLFDNLGDPFAGLEPEGGGTPPPATAAPGPDGPAPQVAAAPATPKFGTLDDPFQVGEPANDAGGVAAAGPPAPAAPDDDPFAGIDLQAAGPSPDAGISGGEGFFGDDTLSQMEDAAAAQDPGAAPSGLELDQDGKLSGKPLPEPEPPSKAVRSEDTARVHRDPAPLAPAEPARPPPPTPVAGPAEPARSGGLWFAKLGFGLIALLLALLLFVAYRFGGRPDLTSWATYVQAFTGDPGSAAANADLRPIGLNNTAYPTGSGRRLVVLWGNVKNATGEKKDSVDVTAKMVNQKGKVLADFTAPAGITFTPLEVHQMDSPEAVVQAYRSRLPAVADLDVPPGGSIPFMLVFFEHPEEMSDVEFRVRTGVSDDPLRGLPPAPEPSGDSSEGAEEPANPAPRGRRNRRRARASRGVPVKKSGTFVRMQPGRSGSSRPGP